MSTNLFWLPPPVEREPHYIDELKYILGVRLWKSDGSSSTYGLSVGPELIPFLEGLAMANEQSDLAIDANELIAAIKKYGSVELNIC